MASTSAAGGNAAVLRLVVAHGTAVVAEWASIIAVLVLVFDRSGADATGVASIGLLVASLIAAPLAGMAMERLRPHRARVLGLTAQGLGCAVAAAGGAADLPLGVVIAGAMVAQGAATVLRPSGAVLMPAHARTSGELVLANLWIWRVEGLAVLAGPVLATALLALGGTATALAGCAVSCLIGAAISLVDLDLDLPLRARSTDTEGRSALGVRSAWRALRGRPGLPSVLAVVWAQYVMIGALDFVLVVIARDDLAMGDAGPGLLSSAFGAGAVVAVFGATRLVERPRLAAALGVALATVAVGFVVLGLALSVAVALAVLPILGISRSVLDGASRLMLQRSVDPASLGSLFTIRELSAGLGLIAGGVFALVALQLGDAATVLAALGAVFAVVVGTAARGLLVADDSADVPVVEMSLLRRVPMFAPLPSLALEAVARSARTVTVPADTTVITQGEAGESFYVVVDGSFDVCMSGQHIRSACRHDFFGEVALIADVPRTATVTATTAGAVLVVDRVDFLAALTGTDSSRAAAWDVVDALDLEPDMIPARQPRPVGP